MPELKAIYDEITPEVVTRLLTEFDWRPRFAAGDFAALKCFVELEDPIGKLLLRSDVCFAGKNYCAALAEFNSAKSVDYLREYLAYYLTRPDLEYDQGHAIGALGYLDEINSTTYLDRYRSSWDSLHPDCPWQQYQESLVDDFRVKIRWIQVCRRELAGKKWRRQIRLE